VTHKENVLRGNSPSAINARKTHCINGHELVEPNIYVNKNSGNKCCKICHRELRKRYKVYDKNYEITHRKENAERVRRYRQRKKEQHKNKSLIP